MWRKSFRFDAIKTVSKVPLVVHLPGSVLRDPGSLAQFYGKIADGWRARGGDVQFLVHYREEVPGQIAADEGFHIIDHGAVRHPRVLNTGTAYVAPFRNMDPWGIRAFSSIAALEFDGKRYSHNAARQFQARLHQRLVVARVSRYQQPDAIMAVPAQCIAVFLQSEAHRLVGETCYLTMREMVTALMDRPDPRPIVIKPHPRDFDNDTHGWLREQERKDRRIRIMAANIHDIIAAADVVITINSAVGIEAMVHGKPLVLCGHSDFHHCARTVRQAEEMTAAIALAEATTWPHAGFLFWYFIKNCVAGGRATLIDDILAKIVATGFDVGRFGLKPPSPPTHQ